MDLKAPYKSHLAHSMYVCTEDPDPYTLRSSLHIVLRIQNLQFCIRSVCIIHRGFCYYLFYYLLLLLRYCIDTVTRMY